jgi:phosphatidylserine decarboxylase
VSVNILTERHEAERTHLEAALEAWKRNLQDLARPIDQNVLVDGRVKKLQSILVKAYKDGPASPRT